MSAKSRGKFHSHRPTASTRDRPGRCGTSTFAQAPTTSRSKPGDDWYDDQVDHYRISYHLDCRRVLDCPGKPTGSLKAAAVSGKRQALELPAGVRTLRIWAVDDAANRGPAKTIRVRG